MRLIALTALAAVLAACGEGQSAKAGAGPTNGSRLAAPQVGADTGYRAFRDWLTGCDNVGTCYAFGHASEGVSGWVCIRMEAGPDAQPEIVVGFWPQYGGALSGPVTAVVNGHVFRELTQLGA